MNRAEEFLKLQAQVNKEIDELGQATEKSFNELETLGDSLNLKEIEETCERHRAQSMYEQGARHW